jgi:putative transposase
VKVQGHSYAVCVRKLGYTRAALYKSIAVSQRRQQQHTELKAIVLKRRQQLPFEGCRKLYYVLSKQYPDLLSMGRDKFFAFMKQQGLLVQRKRRYARTTDSNHIFRIHQNLIEGLQVSHPDQVWVSDITYLRTRIGFVYLALITDLFTRRIVGVDVSHSLGVEGCIRALKMALKQRKNVINTIHHSDRGIQYCCRPYTSILQQNGCLISMAEKGNCYQNAVAERVNGILKTELGLDHVFESLEQAAITTAQAIKLYNQVRPHFSLNYQTPTDFYINSLTQTVNLYQD